MVRPIEACHSTYGPGNSALPYCALAAHLTTTDTDLLEMVRNLLDVEHKVQVLACAPTATRGVVVDGSN